MTATKIGFIGQGFIGKHMADDFENRGYQVVRYALEAPYDQNKDAIADCDVTFIAVPTPTTPEGFDFSTIQGVLPLIGKGKIAVIKSTILPGSTEALQQEFPEIYIMHSPEFLRLKTAAEDTANPPRNIIGTPQDDEASRQRAETVMSLLPKAPYSVITTARNAECIKYVGNAFLYTKVVFMNIAADMTVASGGDWETVRQAVGQDERIGLGHTAVNHDDGRGASGETGRGAGGHCFIKDFEALLQHYAASTDDPQGQAVMEALRNKNNQLLHDTHKDLDLLRGVYGDDVPLN